MQSRTLCEICNPKQWRTISSDMLTDSGYPVYGANGVIGYYSDYNHSKETILITCRGATCGTLNICTPFSYVNGNAMALDDLDSCIDIKYLYYHLSHRGFSDVITGSAQPQIVRQSLEQVQIRYPAKKEQQEIVAVLDSISNLIALRKQQLAKLDELVKARFVEMFGERSGYKVAPLKENVEEIFIGPFGSSLTNDCFVDEEKGYCIVYEQKHAIRKTMNVPTRYISEEKYRELKRFSIYPGDIIVSCRGTIGETYIVPDNAPLGIMHPSIMKIRLNTEKYNRLFFVFLFENYMRQKNSLANGSSVKMAMTAKVIGEELFLLPPLGIQNQFAVFTQKVEKCRLTVQQGLDKLEMMKKALMQKYFG